LIFSLVLFFCLFRGKCVAWATKEGMTWEKDGHRFICKVETCNAFYSTRHLHLEHNLSMELRKLKHPSIQWNGLHCQNHALVNAQVLSNLKKKLWHNEKKAIAWTKTHATC
jgi:hypothetical protein